MNKKLFGTDHIYGLDPFNEVDPPSFEPEYLWKIASDMYATLTAADPKAQWMQMTWMFYFDKDKWTSERMKALLTGVPQNKMILPIIIVKMLNYGKEQSIFMISPIFGVIWAIWETQL